MDKKRLDLIKAAYLYYNKNYTQEEISKIFGVSKMTVSRMLNKAREEDIVKISVKFPYQFNEDLQKIFIKAFSLQEAIIARNIANEDIMKLLGRIGAYNLHLFLRNGDVLGVAGSRTVAEVVKNLTPTNCTDLKVIQLMGSFKESVRPVNSFAITQNISEKLDVDGYFFSAPALADNKKMKDMILKKSNMFQRIIELWETCNIALIGIGNIELNADFEKRSFLNLEDIKELKQRGAVGDILGNFFDINGNFVNQEMQSRILSISPKRLNEMDRLIAIAGGKDKVEAIYGALKTSYIDILITDEVTAKEVYEIIKEKHNLLI